MKWFVALAVVVLPALAVLLAMLLAPADGLLQAEEAVALDCCAGNPWTMLSEDAGGPTPPTLDSTGAPDRLYAGSGEMGTIRGAISSRWFKRKEGAVFIREVKGYKFTAPKKNPALDQRNLTFIPHVLPVVVGSTVDFLNNDNVKHNVHSTKSSPTQFNLGLFGNGETKQVKFEKIGTIALLCNVHAEMSAYLLVCQNPFFSRVDMKDGSFEIKDVPAGTYKLAVFHERVKTADVEVKVEAGKAATVKFGKFKKK